MPKYRSNTPRMIQVFNYCLRHWREAEIRSRQVGGRPHDRILADNWFALTERATRRLRLARACSQVKRNVADIRTFSDRHIPHATFVGESNDD